MYKQSPFLIQDETVNLIAEISQKLGHLEGVELLPQRFYLRKENKIKTVCNSLAIEGNQLNEGAVKTLLEGKEVVGPPKDILEAKNALSAYENLNKYDPFSEKSLLKAHSIFMQGLVDDAGKWRQKGVAIYKKGKVQHMAPPAAKVPELIENLFLFLREASTPFLIKACVFHYELEFIHPFTDGNGRLGRFWQQLLLMSWRPIFEFISVESLIKEQQKEYYNELRNADIAGNSTQFVTFMLKLIVKTLDRLIFNRDIYKKASMQERLEFAQQFFKKSFSRKDYMQLYKTLSTATASRDLAHGVKQQLLKADGAKNQTFYCF